MRFAILALLVFLTADVWADDSSPYVLQGRDHVRDEIGWWDRYVPAGFVGYVILEPAFYTFDKGGYVGTMPGPARRSGSFLYWTKIIPVDVRPNTYSEEFQILAKDRLQLSFKVHAVLRVRDGQESTIRKVVEFFSGPRWYEVNVRQRHRTFVREAVQGYDSAQLNEKDSRNHIENAVKEHLNQLFADKPFVVESVSIGDILFPKGIVETVERNQKAALELQRKETELKIAERDAQIALAKAQGQAKAQNAMQKSLTPIFVQHEAVQAILEMAKSPNKTVIYIPVGSNGVPIITPVDVSNAVTSEQNPEEATDGGGGGGAPEDSSRNGGKKPL